MNRTLLIAAAVAGFATVSSAAFAVDNINPAPTYSATASGNSGNGQTKIMDGNNPAPSYPATASGNAGNGQTKIMDGNNPAPSYASTSSSSTPAKPVRRASKSHKTSVAHVKTKQGHS